MKAVIGLVILAIVVLVWIVKRSHRLGNRVYDEVFEPGKAKLRPPTVSPPSRHGLSAAEASEQLVIQLTLAKTTPQALLNDRWALGYIHGFHDGIMQRFSIHSEVERLADFSALYYLLLDDAEQSAKFVATSLRIQYDADFESGAMEGGREAFRFVAQRTPALGLVDHLRSVHGAVGDAAKSGDDLNRLEERAVGKPRHIRLQPAIVRSSSGSKDRQVSPWWLLMPLGLLGAIILGANMTSRAPNVERTEQTTLAKESHWLVENPQRESTANPAMNERSGPSIDAPVTKEAIQTQASFSCSGSLSQTEQLICGKATLQALDSEMAALYKDLLAVAASPEALRADQRSWIARERDACGDEECLEAKYRQRVTLLRKALE